MTEAQVIEINQYYEKRYGTPKNDQEALDTLARVYQELFKEDPPQEIKDGIAEYYRLLQCRGLPAYSWILEALHVTSKKEDGKRNFSYAVGMLRMWMRYGFGHIPNQEEDDVVDYFEEVTGQEVTIQARRVIQQLLGEYGCIKTTKAIAELHHKEDLSLILALHLKSLLDDIYNRAS